MYKSKHCGELFLKAPASGYVWALAIQVLYEWTDQWAV